MATLNDIVELVRQSDLKVKIAIEMLDPDKLEAGR